MEERAVTAMSTEAPTDATKELRASVSMGVPRHEGPLTFGHELRDESMNA